MASKASTAQEITFTLRNPPYTYIHLSLHTLASNHPQQPLDAITALAYLNSALGQFLGITGTAIPIDVLKVAGQEVWIRVPSDDGSAVVAAVSQWTSRGKGISLRVLGRCSWLGGLAGGEKENLWSLES